MALTAKEPGFIKKYFESSRLHHLSTWKSELIDYVESIMKHKQSVNNDGHPSKVDDPNRTIMHVDMDCFFVSVSIRNRPHLFNKPVVVCHCKGLNNLENPKTKSESGENVEENYSSSEIASCNYEARKYGIKNGMFVGSAKKLCSELVFVSYDFEAYDKCSKELYKILVNQSDYVQAVSCDEALIDVTAIVSNILLSHKDNKSYQDIVKTIAENIRRDIFETTQCHASIGISSNILLAKLATKKAKPNGLYLLESYEINEMMNEFKISGLPGVGWSIEKKCSDLGIYTCGDIKKYSLPYIQKELGNKIGETIYSCCQGKDVLVLGNKSRQSVGSDINWGIRFDSLIQMEKFLKEFCHEVYERLKKLNKTSKHITLIMKKKLYDGEPGKFLGCGHCEDFSKSMALSNGLMDSVQLYQHVMVLYQQINLPIDYIRGIGIHLKQLQDITSSQPTNHPYFINLSSIKSNEMITKKNLAWDGISFDKKKLIARDSDKMSSNKTKQSPSKISDYFGMKSNELTGKRKGKESVEEEVKGDIHKMSKKVMIEFDGMDHDHDDVMEEVEEIDNDECKNILEGNHQAMISTSSLGQRESVLEDSNRKETVQNSSETIDINVLRQLPLDIIKELFKSGIINKKQFDSVS